MVLLGLLLALAPLLWLLPASHTVRLRIERPASLTRLELTWMAGERGGAPIRGADYRFRPGTAPTELTTELSATRGPHRLELRIERGAERRTETHEIRFGITASDSTLVIH